MPNPEKQSLIITRRVQPDDYPCVEALYHEYVGKEKRARETHGDDDYDHRVKWHGERAEAALEVLVILGEFAGAAAA